MKRKKQIIRLTEQDLNNIVKGVIQEGFLDKLKTFGRGFLNGVTGSAKEKLSFLDKSNYDVIAQKAVTQREDKKYSKEYEKVRIKVQQKHAQEQMDLNLSLDGNGRNKLNTLKATMSMEIASEMCKICKNYFSEYKKLGENYIMYQSYWSTKYRENVDTYSYYVNYAGRANVLNLQISNILDQYSQYIGMLDAEMKKDIISILASAQPLEAKVESLHQKLPSADANILKTIVEKVQALTTPTQNNNAGTKKPKRVRGKKNNNTSVT